MTSYVYRRLLALIPMLLGVSIILFIIMQLAPGGPEYFFIGDDIPDADQIESIRRNLGLNEPLHVQYWSWLSSMLRGDLGVSFITRHPVTSHIMERIPMTLQLTLAALVIAVAVGIPIGVISAVKRYSFTDKIATFLAFLGISFPVFWLGVMLVLVFSVTLGWFPASGNYTIGREGEIWNRIHHAVLPTLTLAAIQIATFARYTRSSMLEVLGQEYIRTARSKGLPERTVLYKHALRNSLISVITLMGIQLRNLVAGAALTETVFAWPGIGRLAVTAVFQRDYPLIMGINIVLAGLVIIGNLLVDVAYAWVDPRISYS